MPPKRQPQSAGRAPVATAGRRGARAAAAEAPPTATTQSTRGRGATRGAAARGAAARGAAAARRGAAQSGQQRRRAQPRGAPAATSRTRPTREVAYDDDNDDDYSYDGYSEEVDGSDGGEEDSDYASADFDEEEEAEEDEESEDGEGGDTDVTSSSINGDDLSAHTVGSSSSVVPAGGDPAGRARRGATLGRVDINVRCGVPGDVEGEPASITTPIDAEATLTCIVLQLRPRIALDAGDEEISVSPLAFHAALSGPIPVAIGARQPMDARASVELATVERGGMVALEGIDFPTAASVQQQQQQETVHRTLVPSEATLSEAALQWRCRVELDLDVPPAVRTLDESCAAQPPELLRFVVAELSPQRPQMTAAIKVPAGCKATVRAFVELIGDGAVWSDDVVATVHLQGNLIPRVPATHLAIRKQWFEMKPGILRSPVTTSDGSVYLVPSGSVIQVTRGVANVLHLTDPRDMLVRDGGMTTPRERAALKQTRRAIADAADWVPYERWFTPADLPPPASGAADRTVRVRRFPHRAADVVSVMHPGTVRRAIGVTRDARTGDRYAVWDASADASSTATFEYTRMRGAAGPFLVEVPRDFPVNNGAVECFSVPRWYKPSPAAAAVTPLTILTDAVPAVVNDPPRVTASLGVVEANEVKDAVAFIAFESSGERFLKWREGGWSLFSSPLMASGAAQFDEVTDLIAPFRSRVRRTRQLRPASPDVLDLDDPNAMRAANATPTVPPFIYETRPTLTPRSEAVHRRLSELIDISDTDPQLYELRQKLGTASLAEYPRVALGGADEWDDCDEEDDDGSDGFDGGSSFSD